MGSVRGARPTAEKLRLHLGMALTACLLVLLGGCAVASLADPEALGLAHGRVEISSEGGPVTLNVEIA
jgi:hypothetical protein